MKEAYGDTADTDRASLEAKFRAGKVDSDSVPWPDLCNLPSKISLLEDTRNEIKRRTPKADRATKQILQHSMLYDILYQAVPVCYNSCKLIVQKAQVSSAKSDE